MKPQAVANIAETYLANHGLMTKHLKELSEYLSGAPKDEIQGHYQVFCKLIKEDESSLIFSVANNLFRIQMEVSPMRRGDSIFKIFEIEGMHGVANPKMTERTNLQLISDGNRYLRGDEVEWTEHLTWQFIDSVFFHLYPESKQFYKSEW